MKTRCLVSFVAMGLLYAPVAAQTILFDFNSTSQYTPFPINVTVAGVTAHLSGTGYGYSIQSGSLQPPYGGNLIYPSSVYQADLLVSFSTNIVGFSIVYSPQELGCDSSARMRVTAYKDAAYVGTNTTTAHPPGTWPVGTLIFNSAAGFNRVVVHWDAPPPTGGDYGPIFMADNMTITLSPQVTVSGRITLGDLDGSPTGRQVTLQLRPSGGANEDHTVALDSTGAYSFSTVYQGACAISVKASHWLRRTISGIVIGSSGATGVDLSLMNGDVDGDNEVAIGDYAILSSAFSSSPGSPNWAPEADLNGDDSVDIGDYAILSANFGQVGDN